MRDGWRHVQLGEVARLDCDRVPVEPESRYGMAGVLNAGQGLFVREAITGVDTNYPVLHRLREGQLVMRKLTAGKAPSRSCRVSLRAHSFPPSSPLSVLTSLSSTRAS